MIRNGRTARTAVVTPINTRVFEVNGAKMSPQAITVPRSLIKQVPRMPLPYSLLLKPVSSMTAYTTAMEVVESATPAKRLAEGCHCRSGG